jgi:hypothetical protein
MKRWRDTLVKASLVGLSLAVLVGALVMYLAWADDLSTTIRDEERRVDWSYWLMRGGSWALLTFVPVTAVAAVILRFARSSSGARRRRGRAVHVRDQ